MERPHTDATSGRANLLVYGRTWRELPVGFRFGTASRTITEYDLMLLIQWAGITEPLFADARHAATAGYVGQLVPGVLTYCLSEGLVVQTGAFHGTGVAFLGAELSHLNPVYVGDTIWATVEITQSRETSAGGRGLVSSLVTVSSDRFDDVMTYTPLRLVTG